MPDAFPESSQLHQVPKVKANRHKHGNVTTSTKNITVKPAQGRVGSPEKVTKLKNLERKDSTKVAQHVPHFLINSLFLNRKKFITRLHRLRNRQRQVSQTINLLRGLLQLNPRMQWFTNESRHLQVFLYKIKSHLRRKLEMGLNQVKRRKALSSD